MYQQCGERIEFGILFCFFGRTSFSLFHSIYVGELLLFSSMADVKYSLFLVRILLVIVFRSFL